MSNSSLYGTPPNQDVSSTNSTSLYGGADTPIPTSDGNIVVRGDLIVLSGNILTTASTGNIFPANATTINLGNAATTINIGADTGTTTINNNLVVDGSVTAEGADFGNITIAVADDQTITTTTGELRLGSFNGSIKLASVDALYTDTTGTFNLLNQPTTINAFRNATSLEIGEDTGTTGINNNLRIDGTSINLAQATDILYSEAGNRLNRPTIQSTSGNTSGFRIVAPNTGTSALSTLSVGNSSDSLNTEFLALQARGSGLTDTFRVFTGEYIAGVLGATGKSIAFVDNTNTYATVNPAGPTIGTDLATKTYVDGLSGTTYSVNASTTTGGANFNLVGSDATTDTIKFAQGTGITVVRTDANTITITNTAPDTTITYSQNISSTTGGANLNLVGSDATTDTVKFANGTGVTVAYTDASTATVSIGQAVAVTDAVAFASVTTPAVNSGGASALTITGGAVDPSIITVDGGQTTIDLNGGLGADDAQLLLSSGYLQWIHTAAGMGSVSGTWGLNADGTTSFPSYTFPYADGSSNQVLRTNGSGVLSWYSPADLNTTYDFNATSTTGGANLNLVGSDATTDTVKLNGSTGVTVSYVSGTEVSVAIGQPVATSDSVTFADVTLDTLVNLNTATLTTSTTAADQVADSFVAATYRTCKYVIQITSGSAYQAVEALLVHDGATAYINTYSDVRTGANLSSIGAAVNGANIELQVTPVNAVTTYKISKTLITV